MITIKSFRDIVKLLFIYGREAKLAFSATVILAILAAFILPPRYHSEARVLVKPGRETTTLPIEVADRQTFISPSTQRDPILDEELQVTGQAIASKVAQYYLEQVTPVPPQGVWQNIKFQIKKILATVHDLYTNLLIFVGLTEPQTELDKLTKKLSEKFAVNHAPGSTVMQLDFTWDNPEVAQKVLEKWISTYQEQRTLNLGRRSLYDFYEKEIQRLTSQIQDTKAAISKHLKNIDGTGPSERINALTLEIDKMIHERDIARAELAGMQSAYSTTSKNLENLPEEIIRDKEVSLNPTRVDLAIKLNELEVKRLEKLKVFKPEAPPIKEMDKNIASLKEKLENESVTLQRSQVTSPNELLTTMKKYNFDKSAKVSELSATVAQYDKLIAGKRAERDRMIQLEPELSGLGRDLISYEKSLTLYTESLEKARIDRELDNSRISNIAVIQPATFVPSRVFPNSTMLLASAVPAGIAIAILVIYLCFLADQRIHDGDSIEERFGLPVWTTINHKDDRRTSPSTVVASVFRLYGMLPKDKIAKTGLTIGLASATSGEGVSFVSASFRKLLKDNGINTRLQDDNGAAVKPGEVVIVEASNLLDDANSLILLRDVDLCLLLVEAKSTKVATVERVLALLNTALRKVDGVIVNKRRLELPNPIFNFFSTPRKV